ncbi:MAG TPA: ribonuclease HIII [Solirubrobacteraceae bacterium]|nr:ribonuclease HIII [Solirubrobacteraceae bacterium]
MKVPPARRDALRAAIEQAGAVPREARGSGELWRYELDGATVTLWSTGTCRVQGKGEGREVLERVVAEVAGAAAVAPDEARRADRAATPLHLPRDDPSATPLHLPRDRPWAGVDESGKGDYFGPLVSAAVCVDPAAAAELERAGVADSKRLSDGRVRALAGTVRAGTTFRLTVVAPPRYNALYADFRREGRGLNDLLAWAHARSIEDLLDAGADPAYAIVDQFADARVIERRLLSGTRRRELRVVQFPRAEADVAVAAASILARDEFLRRLGDLPKGGGSPQVVAAARQVVARGGEDALAAVAKLHFATTARVVGRAPSG